MSNDIESVTSEPESAMASRPTGWLKMSTIAAASALAGGLAAAWFYRKTLAQLRQAESGPQNSDFRISEEDQEEDS
jgi:hypothetical protein